jgi:hypothetical protein
MASITIDVCSGNGDTTGSTAAVGLAVNGVGQSTLRAGWQSGGKSADTHHGTLTRFDIDLPEDSKFLSVVFQWTASVKIGAPESEEFRWIWIDHDTLWERTNKFTTTNYAAAPDLPFNYQALDATVTHSRNYPGDASGVITHTIGAGSITTDVQYEWGEGASEDETFTGVVDLLQGYFDSHEADRDANGATGIAVCLSIDKPFSGAAASILWHSENATTESFRPHLILTYDPPPSAELSGAATLDCVGNLDGVLDAELDADATLDAVGNLDGVLSAELDADATLDALGILDVGLSGELDADATLDADAGCRRHPRRGPERGAAG